MANIWWVRTIPQRTPYDMGVDINSRQMYGFSMFVDKAPSSTFEEEVVVLLVAAGVGTFGTDLFAGSKSIIPDGAGPYTVCNAMMGLRPQKTQNVAGISYALPSLRVLVYAVDYLAAKTKAFAAFNALVVVKNQNVTVP